MDLITRADWGARLPRGTTSISKPVRGCALHYEGPHSGVIDHAECYDKVRSIQNFHMNTRGWDDIAYNYLVCTHGFTFEGRALGLRSAAQGTNDGNAYYYAICFLGGVDDPFTLEAQRGMKATIDFCRQNNTGSEDHPHSFYHPTSCPGPEVRAWMANGMPTDGQPIPNPPSPPANPAPPASNPSPQAPAWPGRLIRLTKPYMRGNDVRQWQDKMRARGWNIAVDSVYGPDSQTICKKFQAEKHLSVDGIVGPNTWKMTWEAPVT